MSTERVHFWCDLETTGLEVGRDAILEMAWCFTDTNLKMITPLRQRLTCLHPHTSMKTTRRLVKNDSDCPRYVTDSDNPPYEYGTTFDPTKAFDWNECRYFDSSIVMKMHTKSGLKDDFLSVDPLMVYTQPRDFEREFLNDLAYICHIPNVKVVLSGDGVSHFDNRMLNAFWPQWFPLSPLQDDFLAYWYFDVSTARRMMTPEALTEARQRLTPSLCEAECSLDVMCAPTGFLKPGPSFDRAGLVPHRAADDVVSSLLDARMMIQRLLSLGS